MIKIFKKFALLTLLIASFSLKIMAQEAKDVKINLEVIKEKCKDLPLESRVRITVARFSVTTPSATSELGENMATMLTNALQEINCFRMLEMLKNENDWKGELTYGNDSKMERKNRAQVVVTGEITEFSKQSKSGGAMGVRNSSEIVKLGFIIKLVNPESRDILFSKSINVQGKSNSGTHVSYGGMSFGGGEDKNVAVANALEQGINYAAEFIGDQREKLQLPEAGKGAGSSGSRMTEITVLNTDYDRMSGLETKIKGLSQYKNLQSSLNENQATLSVEHTGTSKQLLDALKSASGNAFDIKGFAEGTIKIQMK